MNNYEFSSKYWRVSILLTTLLSTNHLQAEGSFELGTSQGLSNTTEIYVDILVAGETITWLGNGNVFVYDPSNNLIADLPGGNSITTTLTGAHRLALSTNQAAGSDWDVSVSEGAVIKPGRMYSTEWNFNNADFSSASATNGIFYVAVPTGTGDEEEVIAIEMNGYSGYLYSVIANRTGVLGNDGHRGIGVLITNGSATAEYRVYLNPPEKSSYTTTIPVISSPDFTNGSQACNLLTPINDGGNFIFNSNIAGSYEILCDTNNDGEYDGTAMDDVRLSGTAISGINQIAWDGTDASGTAVSAGNLNCIIRLNSGEMHLISKDVETSYEGLRFFQYSPVNNYTGLPMYWNDHNVQANAVPMLNGYTSPASSGSTGISSGVKADAPVPHSISFIGNARAWGDFTGNSKGNSAYLDTYTVISSDSSSVIPVKITDGTSNSDSDSLTDFNEICYIGTNPTLSDTDSDLVSDGIDQEPLNPLACEDKDNDSCDDCSQGNGSDPLNDGLDSDADGFCNVGDAFPDDPTETLDSDKDGVGDNADQYPYDPNRTALPPSDGGGSLSLTTLLIAFLMLLRTVTKRRYTN